MKQERITPSHIGGLKIFDLEDITKIPGIMTLKPGESLHLCTLPPGASVQVVENHLIVEAAPPEPELKIELGEAE